MSYTFLDDFNLQNGQIILKELQSALEKAVKSSPKSIVVAHYPKENYEVADARLHITANLDAIRQNRNNKTAIKISADLRFNNGGYTSEIEPDFAKAEMSYTQFCNLAIYNFLRETLVPLGEKLKTWDAEHGLAKESDPFNAFDGVQDQPPDNPIKCDNTEVNVVEHKVRSHPPKPSKPPQEPVEVPSNNSVKLGCGLFLLSIAIIFLIIILYPSIDDDFMIFMIVVSIVSLLSSFIAVFKG